MNYTHHYDSPLGGITLASDGKAIVGLWFDDQKYFGEMTGANRVLEEEAFSTNVVPDEARSLFREAEHWLDIYFTGRDPGPTPPLAMETTEFRRAVWEILLAIPYGETMTYGEIAEKIAKHPESGRVSPRAVGGAVGHNAISLMIPCHRVVGRGGKLTGYAGGIEKKARLLALEAGKRQKD